MLVRAGDELPSSTSPSSSSSSRESSDTEQGDRGGEDVVGAIVSLHPSSSSSSTWFTHGESDSTSPAAVEAGDGSIRR